MTLILSIIYAGILVTVLGVAVFLFGIMRTVHGHWGAVIVGSITGSVGTVLILVGGAMAIVMNLML